MTSEQANALLESLVGREVVVILKNAGPTTPNPAGRVSKTSVPDIWEVTMTGLDPLKPPQAASTRQLAAKVSTDDVLYVLELGELSAISPAAIARMPQGGGGGGPIFR
jgi:hypothetical protein